MLKTKFFIYYYFKQNKILLFKTLYTVKVMILSRYRYRPVIVFRSLLLTVTVFGPTLLIVTTLLPYRSGLNFLYAILHANFYWNHWYKVELLLKYDIKLVFVNYFRFTLENYYFGEIVWIQYEVTFDEKGVK